METKMERLKMKEKSEKKKKKEDGQRRQFALVSFPQNGWPPSGKKRRRWPSCLPPGSRAVPAGPGQTLLSLPRWGALPACVCGWKERRAFLGLEEAVPLCFLRQDWPPTPGGGGRWVGPHTQGVQPSYSRAKFSRRVASPITYSTCSATLDRLLLSGSRPSSFILTLFHTPTA